MGGAEQLLQELPGLVDTVTPQWRAGRGGEFERHVAEFYSGELNDSKS